MNKMNSKFIKKYHESKDTTDICTTNLINQNLDMNSENATLTPVLTEIAISLSLLVVTTNNINPHMWNELKDEY